jgi:hypothetical protein
VDGDVHRPRRIDEDTIAYVRHLEIPLQTMEAEDDLEVLVANAHKEIAKHQASLCVHAKCSVVIEVLLRRSTQGQLLEFAASLKGYIQFLVASYYGSHVMQTLLAQLGCSDATLPALTLFCGTCQRVSGYGVYGVCMVSVWCVCMCVCVRMCACVCMCVCLVRVCACVSGVSGVCVPGRSRAPVLPACPRARPLMWCCGVMLCCAVLCGYSCPRGACGLLGEHELRLCWDAPAAYPGNPPVWL